MSASVDAVAVQTVRTYRSQLEAAREALDRWVAEMRSGGWSSQHVEPIRRLSAETGELLARTKP